MVMLLRDGYCRWHDAARRLARRGSRGSMLREWWRLQWNSRWRNVRGRRRGRVLADALVAQGIDHVFEVPGESFLDVLDGFYDVRQRLKLVTCRFEAGATNMAEAYGKLTG